MIQACHNLHFQLSYFILFQNELKALHEAYEEEKEIWIHNFKKEQNTLLYERESEIRERYKKERDREIELIIHRFEEESSRAKLEQEQVTENRIKQVSLSYNWIIVYKNK